MKPQVTITIQTDLEQAAQILAGIHGYELPSAAAQEPQNATRKAEAGQGRSCAQCGEIKPYVRAGGFCRDCRAKKTTEPDRIIEPKPMLSEPKVDDAEDDA